MHAVSLRMFGQGSKHVGFMGPGNGPGHHLGPLRPYLLSTSDLDDKVEERDHPVKENYKKKFRHKLSMKSVTPEKAQTHK